MSRHYSPAVRGAATGTGPMFGETIISHLRAAEIPAMPVASGRNPVSIATARMVRGFRRGRVLIGIFLILHGLAHSRAGTVLIDPARSWRLFDGTALGSLMVWITGSLWAVSMLGFVAGGLGLLGVVGLRRYSRRFVFVAAVASVMLLALAARPYAVAGAFIDVALFILLGFTATRSLRARWLWHPTLLEQPPSVVAPQSRVRRVLRTSGHVIGWMFMAYVSGLVALRPWHRSWGATPAELEMALPGDGMAPHVVATHAVTIDAPATAVWPWLVQIGQDRGGFYSYMWIENSLLGSGIRNADRIHPEWQQLNEGDFVRAARRDWLGGRFADRTGWLVADIEPQRSITLLGWGTFAVIPGDSARSRLVVRSRGGEGSFLWAPVEVLLFEPGHFLMERRMMLGIKERAEGIRGGR